MTTATFSKPGDYVLKLTAGEGKLSASSTLQREGDAPPPAERLDVVYTKPYKIDSPLWNARAKALIVNWIPHCIDQINRTNIPTDQGDGGIDNFIEAAKALRGEPHAPQKGYVFANAWVHQTVEAMCIALMVDPQGDTDIIAAQDKMKATLEDWIPKILAAQEPDGYLQTAYTLADRQPMAERWYPAQPRQSRRLRRRLFHRVGHQPLHADRRKGQAALRRGEKTGGLLGGEHRAGQEGMV